MTDSLPVLKCAYHRMPTPKKHCDNYARFTLYGYPLCDKHPHTYTKALP